MPSQNCEKRMLASSCLSFRPSVRPSAWNDSVSMFRENVVQKMKTHISFSVTFFLSREVYEMTWENIVERTGHR
jgi:hypothetical protein